MTDVSLPLDLTYGKVVGRAVRSLGDGPDAGSLPDGQAVLGKVEFTRQGGVTKTINPSAFVLHEPAPCTLNERGVLVDAQGAPGVWLVTGTYQVKYLTPQGATLMASHQILVTEDHTDDNPLDLVTAAPPAGPPVSPDQYAVLVAADSALSARVTALEAGGGTGGGPSGPVAWADVTGKPASYPSTWATVSGKPATFPPAAHAHAWADVTGKPDAFAPAAHTHTVTEISDATSTGRELLTAADGADARDAIGAGTSSLAIGSTGSTAKAGDWQPAWVDVTGKPATFAPSAHTHTAAQISDATSVGRSLLQTASAAAARSTIGAGTSSLVLGSTSSTAAAGDHSHDSRYVRTVNGTGPDAAGNVAVAAGGGGGPLTGAGFPATSLGNVGDTYIDTDATCGAFVWRKWPNGWKVEQGDTGWRDLLNANILSNPTAFTVFAIRRLPDRIVIKYEKAADASNIDIPPLGSVPSGWRPSEVDGNANMLMASRRRSALPGGIITLHIGGPIFGFINSNDGAIGGQLVAEVTSPWPSAMVGTPL